MKKQQLAGFHRTLYSKSYRLSYSACCYLTGRKTSLFAPNATKSTGLCSTVCFKKQQKKQQTWSAHEDIIYKRKAQEKRCEYCLKEKQLQDFAADYQKAYIWTMLSFHLFTSWNIHSMTANICKIITVIFKSGHFQLKSKKKQNFHEFVCTKKSHFRFMHRRRFIFLCSHMSQGQPVTATQCQMWFWLWRTACTSTGSRTNLTVNICVSTQR